MASEPKEPELEQRHDESGPHAAAVSRVFCGLEKLHGFSLIKTDKCAV